MKLFLVDIQASLKLVLRYLGDKNSLYLSCPIEIVFDILIDTKKACG